MEANMNKKTILKSTIAIVVLGGVLFGALWFFLFGLNDADIGSREEPYDSNYAQTLIGDWGTIYHRAQDGSAIPHEGVIWIFTETEVRYLVDGIELFGRPFAYHWINNNTLRMFDDDSGDQQVWQMTFSDDDTITVNEPNGDVRTLFRIVDIDDIEDVFSIDEPFDSTYAQTLIGEWGTINHRAQDGSTIPNEGVIWLFTETEVRYFVDGVELFGRPFNYYWINNDTLRMFDDDAGIQQFWQMTFLTDYTITVNEPNGDVRTLVRIIENGNADDDYTEEPFDNSNYAQILVGAWETLSFTAGDGSDMPFEGVVWVFSETEVRYFENGVEVMGHPFAYYWVNNDTLRMFDDDFGLEQFWQMKLSDDDNVVVNEPNGNVRTLIRIIDVGN
jgi:archaellum component FlaG (FlaF/FlaG flagellin family)